MNHKPTRSHNQANHLIDQKSPYLLQHAYNPVNWYPWGKQAFAKAQRENKPIFLSIGYSTCHWCHVMAHESFEDGVIADMLNESFVSIKVDREERPDLDRVYMTYVQATTGSGGWPMSVWLTPDLKPFLGGTYFPPDNRWGRPGFKQVLQRIAEAWETDRNALISSADEVVRQLREYAATTEAETLDLDQTLLDEGYRKIKAAYDPHYGGFSAAPKFPHPVAIDFMLRDHVRTGSRNALDMSLFTLRKMADGGMHDHIGGGFHRYSVDQFWHVPHFEKMLYDQAQLACSYLDAFQITHDIFFAHVARDTLDYVLRDLRGPHAFYSAEDADSPLPGNPDKHAEGAFYVWEAGQIESLLDAECAAVFNYYHGIEPDGNVPANADPHGEFNHRNILIVRHTLEGTGRHFNKSPQAIAGLLEHARGLLFEVRAQRPRPHLDDKILTAWNGLMISALARAFQVLEDPRYLAAAQNAAAFIETTLYNAATGTLLRRYRDGEAAIDGFVDDYAFLIQGLIDLYEADFNLRWLRWAICLQNTQNLLFWDDAEGGYFSTTDADTSIILRNKETYDGAEPSPNSVAALNLLRLSQITGNTEWTTLAEKLLKTFSGHLKQMPNAMPRMLVALGFYLDKPCQIVIAGKPGAPDTQALLREVHTRFIPHKVLLLKDDDTDLASLAPATRELRMLKGKATAYVCENFVCRQPLTDPAMIFHESVHGSRFTV